MCRSPPPQCPVIEKVLERSVLTAFTTRSLLVRALLATASIFTDLGNTTLQQNQNAFYLSNTAKALFFLINCFWLVFYTLWPLHILYLLN